MTNTSHTTSLALCAAITLAACGVSAAHLVPVRSGPPAAAATGAPMRLPPVAGSDLAKKQLVVFLKVKYEDQTKDPEFKMLDKAMRVANLELEALLPRMKRFTVYSIYNDGAKSVVRELSELGEMKEVNSTQLPAPDLHLNVTFTFNVEKGELDGKQKKDSKFSMTSVQDYQATMFYTLTDDKGEIRKDLEYASGRIPDKDVAANKIRKFIGERLDPVSNEIVYQGGFNPKNEESQATVIRELVSNVLTGLTAQLALACPLTAKVTALNPSATKFVLEKGSSSGVFPHGKVIVWFDDGDFRFPLAEAEAEPTVDRTTLNVLRWNDADPDAAPVIKRFKADPSSVKQATVWGTTTDIPRREMLKPQ